MARKKYMTAFAIDKFKNLSKTEIDILLKEEVFENLHFKEHVKEVSFKTNIHEEIVEDILRSYFTNIVRVINTVRKIKTKINIFAFISLHIQKGQRI